jgi:hypothetical protein
VFIELDTRRADGFTISLEWDRDTGEAQAVADDVRAASQFVFRVPQASAGDAFRHPFTYAP